MAAASRLNRRRRALLSVTDKTGLVDLALRLVAWDYDILASGGTAHHLTSHEVPVTAVSEVTQFPEIFGGRIKTLHPALLGGILGHREEDFAAVADLGVAPIDVVCVNLYRFAEAANGGANREGVVEAIDIGGPTLLRAAAKNFSRVAVLSDPVQYPEFLADLDRENGSLSGELRQRLAGEAFALIERYDRAIADWFAGLTGPQIARPPKDSPSAFAEAVALRYGENPHQKAWLRVAPDERGRDGLASCGLEQLGGKELSYNNLVDLIAALKLVGDFTEPCCGVIKHTNPCGFGRGDSLAALARALKADPVSAFGGVFAFNQTLDLAAAERLGQMFYEIVVAPDFAGEALAEIRRKKNVRVLTVDPERFRAAAQGRSRTFGRVTLWQEEDAGFPELKSGRVAAGPVPDEATKFALEMAWKVCKHGKSNAIVLADAEGTLGCGFGQMSRVDSAKIALRKAAEQDLDLQGAVAASDGFFPFPDSVELLAGAGIRAVMAPGGSIRDEEVAAAADRLGLSLILAERRHFNH